MSHMEHVVSMEDVAINLGSSTFQSNDVRGAQKSVFLLLLRHTFIVTVVLSLLNIWVR